MDLNQIHKLSSRHKSQILNSKECGCFYCKQFFKPSDIIEWVDDKTTALCPKCGVDSILPDNAGFKLDLKLLEKMSAEFFARMRFTDN